MASIFMAHRLNLCGKDLNLYDNVHHTLTVWAGERLVAQLPRQAAGIAVHPAQWDGVPSAAAQRHRVQPVGHQQSAPVVAHRPLATYDVLCGVEVSA